MLARVISLLRRATVYADARVLAQGDPAAGGDAATTLTIANLLSKLITVTPTAARAYTLPTGTLSEAGVNLRVDESFDWSLVNLAAATHAVTVTAGTDHTVVGLMAVAAKTTGTFRTRKTDLNTFVTYRIG